MKMTFGILAAVSIVFSGVVWAQESNDSLEALTNAQKQVRLKLDQFAINNANHELLLEAQKISASLNPRGDNKTALSPLDEGCLRLQLKMLLALEKARDPHYDRNAQTNAVYLNVAPPISKGNEILISGMDPKAIKDAEVRKAYEDAIAENNRRNEKLKREIALSRGAGYALLDIWLFVKRGLPENSAARNRAIKIVTETLSDKSLLERFNSNEMPGQDW